jgi:hypothetical protein
MRENRYQAGLIKRLQRAYPGCVILKNDPQYQQGIPDLTVLHGRTWAVLESKTEVGVERPNQRYYVEMLDRMSFAAFIDPSNEEEVLYGLQQAFEFGR